MAKESVEGANNLDENDITGGVVANKGVPNNDLANLLGETADNKNGEASLQDNASTTVDENNS